MSETWGPEFFKEKLEEKLDIKGVAREFNKVTVKSESTERVVTFKVQTSKNYKKADGRYSVGDSDRLEENKTDFRVFCFEKAGTRHCVIVSYEEFKSFMKKHSDLDKRYNFGLKLIEDGKVKAIGCVSEKTYSDYDEKGWDLVKKALV